MLIADDLSGLFVFVIAVVGSGAMKHFALLEPFRVVETGNIFVPRSLHLDENILAHVVLDSVDVRGHSAGPENGESARVYAIPKTSKAGVRDCEIYRSVRLDRPTAVRLKVP
jgi:hypothetical protein